MNGGIGPKEILTTFEGHRALVHDEDVVVLGFRDSGEAAGYGSQPLPSSIKAITLEDVRVQGADTAARTAVEHLSRDALDGFWIHLDADVLGDAIMPAVDYRMPNGLSWHELEITFPAALTGSSADGRSLLTC